MKKLISMLLAVVMICSVMTVPAFATSDFVYGSSSEYGMEYGESGGMVGVIRKTDEFGKTIYVHGSPLNNKVFALVNAPAMDYTKTIGSVTFSNYIKHNEKTLNTGFNNGVREKIKVTQVYVGIGASMRSNVDDVEFMMSYNNGAFNDFNSGLLQGYDVTSDLALVKTNTPAYSANNGTPYYEYIDYFSIRPYTNLGRNYDGTWQKGLTWVFEEHTEDYGGGSGWGYASDPNQYRKIYAIRVETPNGTEYYQVIVTAEKNFAGEKQEAPVEPPKVETPTVEMPTLKSFDDVDPTRWSHNAIMLCVQHGAIAGTKTPDANGVGEFNPTGTVTVGQFITVLTRLVASDLIQGSAGEGEHWASPNYWAAVNSGMIRQTDFTLAELNNPISREDMAFLLVKAAELNGETLEAHPKAASVIKDYNKINPNRKGYVTQCYSNGLIAGYSDGSFGYADTMTREQMATVVCRLMEYAPRGEVKFEEEKAPVVQNSDYFYESGMVKTETQIAVVKDNFNNVRLYKNAKGELCVDVSAVSLPKALADAGWKLSISVSPLEKGSGVPMSVTNGGFTLGNGESGSDVISRGNARQGYVSVKVSDFDKVMVTMSLYHNEHTDSKAEISFKSISDTTNVITGFYRNASLNMKNENISMNVSSVYSGLK